VRRRDFVNGAVLGAVARRACELAYCREIETGVAGVRAEDLMEAADDAISSAVRALTPRSARDVVSALADDADVVRIELASSAAAAREYLHVRAL
jgi:hypothetical protein